MNTTLNSVAVMVSKLPISNYRGFYLKKGKVVISDDELSLVSRWSIGGENIYGLLYSEIDGYSMTLRGLWIRHHNKSVPKYVLVRKYGIRNGTKANEELHILAQFLEAKGIKSH